MSFRVYWDERRLAFTTADVFVRRGFRRISKGRGESGFAPLSLADHNCQVGKKNKNVDNGVTLHTRGAEIVSRHDLGRCGPEKVETESKE